MLRFSTSKIVAHARLIVIGLLLAVPSMLTREQRDGFKAVDSGLGPAWLVPTRAIVLGLDLQGGSHVLLEVDSRTSCAPRRCSCATTCGASCAKPASRRGRHPDSCRAACSVRVPDASAARAKLLPKLRELSQPIGNALLGQTGGAHHRHHRAARRPDPAHLHRCGRQRARAPRRRPGHRGAAPPRRRARHDRAEHPAPGRRPHPGPGAGPAGPAAPEGDPRHDGEARVPHAGRARARPATSSCCPPGRERPARSGRAPRNGARAATSPTRSPASTSAPASRSSTSASTCAARSASARRRPRTSAGRMAIVLDNEVISAPRILQPITGGSGQISGRFTVQQANDLAVLLRAGALPAKLTIVEERTVGPGLGARFHRGRQDGDAASRPRSWSPSCS